MSKEILVPDDIKKFVSPRGGRDFFAKDMIEEWDKREKFRSGVSWHVPTQEVINLLLNYGPIVSVGSGFAYTESIAIAQGADIISTDIEPNEKNGWCRGEKFYCNVEKLSAIDAVKKYKGRNVFMAWPPYNTPMAHDVVSNMEVGAYLIYIGEGHGGCTGDDNFFECLYSNFEEIDDIAIPQWMGLHDYCTVYKKIK
jgi:hypothetical protein